MPGRPDRIVAEILKSACEAIRVIFDGKAGQLGADLRIASTTGRRSMQETQKGLRIPTSRLGDVIDPLRQAQRLVEEPLKRPLTDPHRGVAAELRMPTKIAPPKFNLEIVNAERN